MKSLFYILSVLAIGAAGYFGWTARENYGQQLEDRNGLITQNDKLSKSIRDEEDKRSEVAEARTTALDEEAEKKAALESASAKEKEIRRTLAEYQSQLEEAVAAEKVVDNGIVKIKDLFPDIELEEVAGRLQQMEEQEKKLNAELEDLELFKTKLTEEIAKNGSEIVRVEGKVAESMDNIRGNTFQASVTAVDNRWDFVIIGAGEKSGLTPETKLLVVRGGKLIGKLSIHQLEANRAVADIDPGSVKVGSSLRPGDQVILEKVRAN